jgi:hypothetical protein
LEEEAAMKLERYNDKLEKAEIRKAQHLDKIKDKAKEEGEKIDENAFILSLTLQNKKIDLEDKIQINSERRQKFLDDILIKTVETRERKHEAFHKKREIIREQSIDKFLAKTAKIESARERKHQEVEKIRRNARTTIKKAIASKKRKKIVDNKINKLISMISNINENEWENLPSEKNETEKFKKQKERLKNQAKVLDKMVNSCEDYKIDLTKSETDDLFDDSSSDDDEDLLFKSKHDYVKSHSDTELDCENIPLYFKNSILDGIGDKTGNIDRFLIHSSTNNENDNKLNITKALSESPRNTNIDEKKEAVSKVILSQDMLLKLDEHNKNKATQNEITGHGLNIAYYATPSIISNASNATNAKTVKAKKATKLAPNKKYLVEMKPITVLIKLIDKGSKSRYVSAEMTLSHDPSVLKDEVKIPNTHSKMSKHSEN